MASPPLLSLLLACILPFFGTADTDDRRTYIIHIDPSAKPDTFPTDESWHRSLAPSDHQDDNFLYSYNHVVHGFSASLSLPELTELENSPAHVATFPDSTAKLFTTHTPRFLGLHPGAQIWPAASQGRGVIVGIIDTGVWPESDSFNDEGMPPVPEHWNGECETGAEFRPSMCNRKLIGARSFSRGLKASGVNVSTDHDYDSPRDFMGHGTHTASTAAGGSVAGVGYYGYAGGTASGIAPAAHVAMYKVLWADGPVKSMTSDILAGMDKAIADGVDVMSLSIGVDEHKPYYKDVIAIAALSAVAKGIAVICAAGNDGTGNSTHNGAPWITTVGAGTVDRSFLARLTLGDGSTVEGVSYYPLSIYITGALLYHGGACRHSSLSPASVRGKVVVCDLGNATDIYGPISEIDRTGAAAGIVIADPLDMDPGEYYSPVMTLRGAAAATVRTYMAAASNATMRELKFVITKVGPTTPAPAVAFFSSRGPDPVNPTVLKPDMLAPGKDVVAAWAPNRPYGQVGYSDLWTDYALVSGTSMAAPHVAGVTALIRAVHKDWSPAAIRSAIMTTATAVDNTGNAIRDEATKSQATPFDFGAGHVNPNRAIDPGLVYDVDVNGYVDFLCGLGYTEVQMSAMVRGGGDRRRCTGGGRSGDLNYPSFVAVVAVGEAAVQRFRRVVTNVGGGAAVYRAVFNAPEGVTIRAEPEVLVFGREGEKRRFVLTLEISGGVEITGKVVFGFVKWIDEHGHVVSSPVVVVTR